MVDDGRQFRPALYKVRRRKLALENRVLQMVAIGTHRLKHLTKPLVVADVVAHQIRRPHAQSQSRFGWTKIPVFSIGESASAENLRNTSCAQFSPPAIV